MTGRILEMDLILLLGAFNKIYLDFLAFKTDLILNLSLLIISTFDLLAVKDFTRTASELFIFIISFKLFLNKVLPLETRSHIASAKPIFGAISTEPLII